MSYDGMTIDGNVDVFTGPAIPAAIEHAKSIAPGKIRLTRFTAWDTGELIGLDGRSLIVKLPESALENNHVYLGQRWFLNGKARGPIEYGQEYAHWYIEKSRCWLADIALLRNWFADENACEFLVFRRFKSLDTGQSLQVSGPKLRPPEGYVRADYDIFMFDVAYDADVEIEKDIPIAIWYVLTKGSQRIIDIRGIAGSAPFACVFYLRFRG